MSKQSQVLQIDPPTEILFKGPFTDVVTSYIKLTNPSERQICFKVKTTAPKQYCVRPNSGLIAPKESVSVSVMLQPFDYNAEDRNKHKFMVQTAYVPDGEHSLDNIWKNTPPPEMMDSKLRVVFDVPEAVTDKSASKPVPPAVKSGTQISEAEFRRAADDAKRLQHQLYQLEHENGQLRERLLKMEAGSDGIGGMGGGGGSHGYDGMGGGGSAGAMQRQQGSSAAARQHYTLMHILLAFVSAIVLGLILGRAF